MQEQPEAWDNANDDWNPAVPESFEEAVALFLEMNTRVGIQMTYNEAVANYVACMDGLDLVQIENKSIEEAIEIIQMVSVPEFNPALCRKFLTEATALFNELKRLNEGEQ